MTSGIYNVSPRTARRKNFHKLDSDPDAYDPVLVACNPRRYSEGRPTVLIGLILFNAIRITSIVSRCRVV